MCYPMLFLNPCRVHNHFSCQLQRTLVMYVYASGADSPMCSAQNSGDTRTSVLIRVTSAVLFRLCCVIVQCKERERSRLCACLHHKNVIQKRNCMSVDHW